MLLSLVALGPVARVASIVALAHLFVWGHTCRLRPRLGKHGRKLLVEHGKLD
jgi:hypothetical protein